MTTVPSLALVIDDEITGSICMVKASKALWLSTLKAKYQSTKGVALFILKRVFWSDKKGSSESIQEYPDHVAMMCGKVKAQGNDMSKPDYCLATHIGLDSCYNNHFKVLEQLDDQLTREHNDATLLQEELRQQCYSVSTALTNQAKDYPVITFANGTTLNAVAQGDNGLICVKTNKGNIVDIYLKNATEVKKESSGASSLLGNVWVHTLADCKNVADIINNWIRQVEKATSKENKVLCSGNSGEYVGMRVQQPLQHHSIPHKRSAPYTSQPNYIQHDPSMDQRVDAENGTLG
ncbi:hypothetical protein K437DRAFT_275981 [Tilletiaria anomala UBC 951]|uniref:Uncharacterized protein n=1 Tax=Tilletiaria anomala (strain ATCC 24038 / CBS 436.72 / UBC 951) TaxID=1037660 RepID=A0A066VGU5_TILAU|nr:uncharacterized protein K437DRAFT_275981 [Tilletiaria anomala UBC 951]KDN39523.1 hypothetical protein K437DRAFT_275981 [Tilletiaria anomala UBC 951]